MFKHYPLALLIFCLFLSYSCSKRLLDKSYNPEVAEKLYSNSIGDAAKPQPWEISNDLTAINASNHQLIRKEIDGESYILVSSWKADTTYYKNDPATGKYNTGTYSPIWVTLSPELQSKCQVKKFGRKEGLNLRLKQLLGLPPNVEKKYFVEFWVRPQDLFRPCPDAEITDKDCQLGFPQSASTEHQDWINQQRIESYYHEEWDKNYPWTELGYTYDWNRKIKNNIGLSEFVIKQNKDIVVHKFYTTWEYCREPAK